MSLHAADVAQLTMGARGRAAPLSVAPMMDRTDRHFRVVMRALTRGTLLYTEMITAAAILRGDRSSLLGFSLVEQPVALQLGGDDPRALADAARIGFEHGYREINLNAGCPSDRVQSGRFGACLMAEPDRVAAMVSEMRAAVPIPVTVKHRIGIDGRERYEDLLDFVDRVAAAGADRFIVHARIAVLAGLSPAENRTVPPLRYGDVFRLKQERPDLAVEINGGVRSLSEAATLLERVDGVMIGRAAYETPWIFSRADPLFFGRPAPATDRIEAARSLLPYIEAQRAEGVRLMAIARHLLEWFAGLRGARAFRRYLSEEGHRPGAGPEVVERALRLVGGASEARALAAADDGRPLTAG